MVCTAVTTICGVWLAYGEPPNLIMKANLVSASRQRLLPAATALPAAVASYLVIAWQLRGKLGGQRDRSRQHGRHRRQRRGRAVSAGVAARRSDDADRTRSRATRRISAAARAAGARAAAQRRVARPRADPRGRVASRRAGCCSATSSATNSRTASTATTCSTTPGSTRRRSAPNWRSTKCSRPWRTVRRRAQKIGALALVPFVALLVVHGIDHEVPLFLASFAGVLRRAAGHRAHSEDARRWRCAKRCRNTPSTTSCFRCFCRSRC